MDGIQQEVDARAAVGIHVLLESVAQATSSTCTRHVLAITPQMFGRGLCKTFGTRIKSFDHFWCCAFLRRKYMGCPILTTKRIGDIRRYR